MFAERRLKRLKVEIHERGRITTSVYDITSGSISGIVGEEEVRETGVDDFLVVPVFNLSTSDRLTGLDDYSDLDSIVQELETRVAQISRILDKHADPNLAGPDTALEQDPKTGEVIFRGGGKYFPLGPGDQPPHMTWDGQLRRRSRNRDPTEQFYALRRPGGCVRELKQAWPERFRPAAL